MSLVELADPTTLLNAAREINRYLGGVVVALLLWRLIPMIFDRRRWGDHRAMHTLAWFVWVAFSISNATAAAVVNSAPAEWPQGTRLLLNLIAIALCLWWPHPLRWEPATARPWNGQERRAQN